MLELLFLLLPLAFLSGWQSSKKRNKKTQSNKRELSDNFVKGINFLLSEEPDKALEVFLTRPEIDEYTAETYLLLGNMFRNRGEVDRALRVHQNLIGRSNLAKKQKVAAMLSYGEDFFAAGMLDRAEGVFQELIKNNEGDALACGTLRSIYEQLQDWDKAIEVAHCAEAKTGDDHSRLIAHYYCELAEHELEQGNIHLVEDYLDKAYKEHKKSNRILMIRGDLDVRRNNLSSAFKKYKQVVTDDSRLLGLLNLRLVETSKKVGSVDKLFQFLQKRLKKEPDGKVFEYLVALALEYSADNKVKELLENELPNCKPSVKATLGMIKLWTAGEKNERLELLKQSLEQYLQGKADYYCNHCGYQMIDFAWRCPACHYWDNVAHR